MTYHDNGQIKSEGLFKKGAKDGLWVFWDKKGQKMSELFYYEGDLLSKNCWESYGNDCECDDMLNTKCAPSLIRFSNQHHSPSIPEINGTVHVI
ncbi:MAG: hypothetical protein ISR82_06250 [Candidatus Marinimicrobia bacterium]|nr:hypothetical protein [Candidatus Neomarinimicrobiota bacterium]